jgi:hypothetical protein
MTDQVRRFELGIVRPLHILFILLAVTFALKSLWWWLAGCIVALFYVGVIGSKLHPLQSASDLAQGPTTGAAAYVEADLMSAAEKHRFVDHACIRVGYVVGIGVGVVLWRIFGWHWYWALLVLCLSVLFIGCLLQAAFKVGVDESGITRTGAGRQD